MRIVITGGLGFIGSHLALNLLEAGEEVCVIDRETNQDVSKQLAKFSRYTEVLEDVSEEERMAKWINWCDVVFHLAAVLGVRNCVENPTAVIEGNLNPTMAVLKAAKRYGKKVIFASTSEVYGKNRTLPFREDGDRLLGATSTHRWCYSTVKALEEHLFLAAAKEGLPVTIVRYFNAYGPRAVSSAYGGVVPIFIKAALTNEPLYVYGDGSQSRCFTYVLDSVKATVRAIGSQCDGEVINVGSTENMTILTLAKTIIRLAGSQSEIRFVPVENAYGVGYEDMQERMPSTDKMEKLLQTVASTTIEAGLKETIASYRLLF